MTKEAIAVVTALAGIVIFFTLITGGKLSLGTSPAGPSFSLGFSGPQSR